MDNITHSLVGALTAEMAVAFLKIKKPEWVVSRRTRVVFLLSALLGSNLCDLDFIISLLLKPTRLQYLLHHRGHTHTLITAPFQAGLIFLGFWLFGKFKKIYWDKVEITGIVLLSFLGVVLHLLFDSLNQYGVHPFWPFYNGWFYADMLFIVEPWVWVTLLPLLFFSSGNRFFRAFIFSIFIAGLALIWFSGFIPWGLAAVITTWSGFIFILFMYFGNHTRIAICISALFLICLVFGLESRWLKNEIKTRFEKEEVGVEVKDVILSPFPSNPLCWHLVTVETLPTRLNYKLRRGIVALFSNLYTPEQCLHLISAKEVVTKTNSNVVWTTEMKLSRQELQKLYKKSCYVAAQLKFVRAPFWYQKNGKLYFADLRFETGGRGNFSSFEIPSDTTECPRFVPPWIEPRLDLLTD